MPLKKLHKLTLQAFLPPFFATLFISVFLLFLVQIVITYLDDFLGKGLRAIDLFTLFFYAWITIVPQCIPLAVLLGSIMSFGNLAESYELAAMKSSGISLYRIMSPVLIFIILLAGATFLFNNFVLPVVQLKSAALLYDIRQKKPSVNIKDGIFYNGIENYSLRVGRKSENKDTLYDIYIYDHSDHQGNNVQLYARSGKITMNADTTELVQILRDGNRYKENIDPQKPGKRSLSQLSFKQMQVNIPLEDFKQKRTNEALFKSNEKMMNVWQLDSVIDSSKRVMKRRAENLNVQSLKHFFSRTAAFSLMSDTFQTVDIREFYKNLDAGRHHQAMQNAMNIARSASGNIEAYKVHTEGEKNSLITYQIEWHEKIVICFACLVLFFVGAPLGAIIKKGGLGLPVIISVLFFLAYYIITEMFKQLALENKIEPGQSMWTPLFIFLPVSIFLTTRAAKDSSLFDLTFYYTLFNRLFRKKPIA